MRIERAFSGFCQARTSVLLVGASGDPHARNVRTIDGISMIFARIDDVTPCLVARMAPPLVLSPLITPRFDALDLALVLSDAGFAGTYLAATIRLPDGDVVKREVRALCPHLRFGLIYVD